MLQGRYETGRIFEDILKLINQMDPTLAEIDRCWTTKNFTN